MKSHDACLFKRAYETEAEATGEGQEVYFCLYCERWHRRSPMSVKAGPLKWRHAHFFMKNAIRRIRRAA